MAAPDDLAALSGDWSGLMPIQPTQHLIFHIRKAGDAVQVTLDSPERNVAGVPVPEVHRDGAKVSFAVPSIRLRYEGALDADGRTLRGGMTQGDLPPLTFDLALQPAAAAK